MNRSPAKSFPASLLPLYRSLRYPTGGTKRRFGIAGVTNILLTNVLLQLLLHASFSVAQATFLAQLFNGVFGYISYGKLAFGSSLLRVSSAGRYLLMAFGLWLVNWAGIQFCVGFGMAKSLAALLMIPVLALVSFLVQSHWVFAD